MQMRRSLLGLILVPVCLSFGAGGAQGQEITLRRAGPRTLTGIVRDTTGFAIDGEVMIVQLRRRVTASADGRFSFADVKPGRYQVGVRRLGYFPQVKTVTVSEDGGVVEFLLVPLRASLPPVVTSAARGGLSGVIGDTSFSVIAGASVEIVSTVRRAVSDSLGQFFIDAPAGKYMVRVKRAGYGSRLISVTVPADSGRRMLVWLSPATAGSAARDEAAIDGLRDRLMRRNVVWSNMYTREDINRVGFKELAQIAQSAAGQYVSDIDCLAILPGTGRSVPLWTLSAAELEAVEVYFSNQKRPSYAIGGNSARNLPTIQDIATPPSALKNCPTIYAWVRK
jgi:hypothetical protein